MLIRISDPDAMEEAGRYLAADCNPGMHIHLSGELGAGKTTLVRGFLRGLGYAGKVKSPTYTLVESYDMLPVPVFHFDFYRIEHPDEIEAIGFREYAGGRAVCLVEWAEKGGDRLEIADVKIKFTILQDAVRELRLQGNSDNGKSLIYKLSKRFPA